jgi:radical SAM superfamily enzyme YgiQ (UPF0313 family)
MEVCLVNAATAAEFTDVTEFNAEEIRRINTEPHLGILSLAAVLDASGCRPTIVDLNRIFYEYADAAGEDGLEDFAKLAATRIGSIDADVFGFGSICSAYPLSLRIAKCVKQLRPEATVIFGGPQASVVSDQTLAAFPFVDFVLRGEAEESLKLLLEELFGRRRFEVVPGLTFRSVWGIKRNVDAPLILDLDALLPPAYHLTGELRGRDRAYLELGRGCPFSCTFCSTNDFFRRKFRLHSPERMVKDMRAIESEYGIRDFDMVHDMFTVDRKRVQAFCHALLDSGDKYTWSCSARTDCVDEELIELMAASGCKGMFFGVETGSERMQRIIDKHLDTRRAHAIIDIAERAGIRSTVSLITGFPEETKDDLQQTIRMFMHSARAPHSGPQLNLLAPLANTPIHAKYKDQMTLDLLCSDMSHQGRKQHDDDMELIRNFPDIFPNFYLVPTPDLERAMLLELREFTLMAELRFRWLLGAADQASAGILELFLEWRQKREAVHPGLVGSDLRQYYRTPQFSRDFVSFLHGHAVGTDLLVRAFLEYEDAVAEGQSVDGSMASQATIRNVSEGLDWSDIPIRRDQARVIRLTFPLEEAIDSVKNCRKPKWETGQISFDYVVKQAPGRRNPVYQVSREIANTVEACDGRRTISQVVQQLSTKFAEIPESKRDNQCIRLIEIARTEGLIAIFRNTSRVIKGETSSHELSFSGSL